MIIRLALMASALSTATCGSPAPNSDTPDKDGGAMTQAEASIDWSRKECDAPQNAPDFADKTESALAALGKPTREERFALGKGMNEFRIELLNIYPMATNAALPVMERTWSRKGCNLTIWFVEKRGVWTSVRASRWPDGVQF